MAHSGVHPSLSMSKGSLVTTPSCCPTVATSTVAIADVLAAIAVPVAAVGPQSAAARVSIIIIAVIATALVAAAIVVWAAAVAIFVAVGGGPMISVQRTGGFKPGRSST
jgi:hypothetical protein